MGYVAELNRIWAMGRFDDVRAALLRALIAQVETIEIVANPPRIRLNPRISGAETDLPFRVGQNAPLALRG